MADALKEKLITSVQGFPSLYSTRRLDYKDVIKKANSWETVAIRVGCNVEQCKRMWKNLKDTYRQATNAELKRMKSGSGATSKKPWKFMELMSFLKPFVSTESGSCSNVQLPPNGEYDSDVEVVQAAAMQGSVHRKEDSQEEDSGSQDDIVPEIEESLQFSSSRSTMAVPPAMTPKHVSNAVGRKRKTATDDIDRSLLDFIAKAEQTQASLLEKVILEPSVDNEENLIGKSVAAALRRLTPYKRALAKVKIQELLFEIEFGTQDDQRH